MFLFAEVHESFNLVDVIFDWKSNVINWLLLVGFIVYACSKLVPPILENRRKSIEDQLSNARKAKQDAEAYLEEQKKRIADSEKEASKIIDEAKTIAAQLKKDIAEQTARESAELERKIEMALQTERQMLVNEVRTAAVKAAVELSRSYLEQNVSEEDNKRLLTGFMQQLDTISSDGQSFDQPAHDSTGAAGGGRVGSLR